MISNNLSQRQDIYYRRDNSLTLEIQLIDEVGTTIELAGISLQLEVYTKREKKVKEATLPSGLESATADLRALVDDLEPSTYHYRITMNTTTDRTALIEGDLIVVDKDVTSIPSHTTSGTVQIAVSPSVEMRLQVQGIYATHADMKWTTFNL